MAASGGGTLSASAAAWPSPAQRKPRKRFRIDEDVCLLKEVVCADPFSNPAAWEDVLRKRHESGKSRAHNSRHQIASGPPFRLFPTAGHSEPEEVLLPSCCRAYSCHLPPALVLNRGKRTSSRNSAPHQNQHSSSGLPQLSYSGANLQALLLAELSDDGSCDGASYRKRDRQDPEPQHCSLIAT
ncbi:hypothetical protein HPB51_007956 [Rhipicephalus microplus]|uniref:Uncharacterized protein n=1 Tax=Rhipicephalus microplus TaxID=6941 RepID=A0A9J6DUE5_RHIMP|nr:hypothetical protein HPB51_007956 [Rhipicephalus microplus]